MSIQTEITQKDYRAFVRHLAKGPNGAGSMKLLIGSGIVTGFIIGIVLFLTRIRLDFASLMVGLFGGVVWITYFYLVLVRNMSPAKDGCTLGSRTILLNDDGICHTAQNTEGLFRWPSVRSAESVGEHIFVMVDRNAAIIIPHRAFSSDAERDQFFAEILHRTDKVPRESVA